MRRKAASGSEATAAEVGAARQRCPGCSVVVSGPTTRTTPSEAARRAARKGCVAARGALRSHGARPGSFPKLGFCSRCSRFVRYQRESERCHVTAYFYECRTRKNEKASAATSPPISTSVALVRMRKQVLPRHRQRRISTSVSLVSKNEKASAATSPPILRVSYSNCKKRARYFLIGLSDKACSHIRTPDYRRSELRTLKGPQNLQI